MASFHGEVVPMHRFLLGLIARGLPRNAIPGGFRDLPPGGADESVPYSVGQARPRQFGGLADQLLMIGN